MKNFLINLTLCAFYWDNCAHLHITVGVISWMAHEWISSCQNRFRAHNKLKKRIFFSAFRVLPIHSSILLKLLLIFFLVNTNMYLFFITNMKYVAGRLCTGDSSIPVDYNRCSWYTFVIADVVRLQNKTTAPNVYVGTMKNACSKSLWLGRLEKVPL